MGNKKELITNLRALGFIYGNIRRKNQIVMKKSKIEKPKNLSDWVYLDISFSPKEHILETLRKKVNFTINGFALNIKDLSNKNWFSKLTILPYSIADIQSKQLRLNTEKDTFFGTDLYACIRFMSVGFKKPSQHEIELLLKALAKMQKYKFEKNKEKVFRYVGSIEKTKKLVKKMGLDESIFAFKTVLKLRNKK